MVSNETQSSGIGGKNSSYKGCRRAIRTQFFELTGIPAGTQKHYEMGRREGVGSEILLKITQHPRFAKYTLWLMTDKTAPQAGQIAPALAHIGPESTGSDRSEKQTG